MRCRQFEVTIRQRDFLRPARRGARASHGGGGGQNSARAVATARRPARLNRNGVGAQAGYARGGGGGKVGRESTAVCRISPGDAAAATAGPARDRRGWQRRAGGVRSG